MASNHSHFAPGSPLYRTATLILGAVLCPANTQAARPPLVEPPYCETTVNPQGRPPLVKPPYCPPAGDMAPKLVSPRARASGLPAISDNGRYIAYITNIVRQQGEQQRDQIFLWDAKQKNRHLISQDNDKDPDKQGEGNSLYPAINGDGSRVVYASDARDIDPDCADGKMNIYLRIWDQLKTADCISKSPVGVPAHGMSPSISGDGLTVSWSGPFVTENNKDQTDIFVWTNPQGIRRVSLASNGGSANGSSESSSLDQSGQRITFTSEASNLIAGDSNKHPDIFVRSLNPAQPELEQTALVSVGFNGEPANDKSAGSTISRNGLVIAFVSAATNLVTDDTNDKRDVFIRDLADPAHPVTVRVSLSSDGKQANGDSDVISLTADGRCVAFQSDASNLAPEDKNASTDAYVHDRQTGRTERVSLKRNGREGNDDSFFPSISADGTTIAFTSTGTQLTRNSDHQDNPDVYVVTLPDGLCH